VYGRGLLQSLWNPFRDWNAKEFDEISKMRGSFKASETLLGIETIKSRSIFSPNLCFKASETLLGIETNIDITSLIKFSASKPLKPF